MRTTMVLTVLTAVVTGLVWKNGKAITAVMLTLIAGNIIGNDRGPMHTFLSSATAVVEHALTATVTWIQRR